MAQTAMLSAAPRTGTGKGVARTLRRDGKVPAVIYGRGRNPEPLVVDALALERLLAKVRHATTLVDLTVEHRAPVKALIREIQRDPIRPTDILHIDLYEVHADEKITVEVPLSFVGTAEGVRNAGGVFDAVLHSLQIRVLPGEIPDKVEVDVTDLAITKSLHVRDITLPKGEILTDPGVTICTVVPPRAEEEVAAPAAETVEPSEPELIRKPKGEEEGEGEAEA